METNFLPSVAVATNATVPGEHERKAERKESNKDDMENHAQSPIYIERLRPRYSHGRKENIKTEEPELDSSPFIPKRLYYHSGTYHKKLVLENDFDVDSDDEIDESWQDYVEGWLLDEYIDVSEKEKAFMTIWNKSMPTNFGKGKDSKPKYCMVPKYCMMFIQKHAKEIRELGLDEQLILHLTNLVDENFIAPHHLYQFMREYKNNIGMNNTAKTNAAGLTKDSNTTTEVATSRPTML